MMVSEPTSNGGQTPRPPLSHKKALRCRRDLARALEAVARRRLISASSIVWPRGLDLRIVRELRLPLHQQNALLAGLTLGELPGDGRPLTVRHLHSLTGVGFGPRQLAALVRALEDWLIESSRSDGRRARSSPKRLEIREPSTPRPERQGTEPAVPPSWRNARTRLRPVLEMAALFKRAETLKDILHPRLRRITSELRRNPELDQVRIADLLGPGRSPVDRLRDRVHEAIESLSAVERLVTRRRLLRAAVPLEDVGRHIGGDAATARAVETRVRRKLGEAVRPRAAELGRVLRQVLGSVCDRRDLESALCRLLPPAEERLSDLMRDAIRENTGYTVFGQACLDDDALRLASSRRRTVRSLADDAGLIPEDRLSEVLPAHWGAQWSLLFSAFGLHEVVGHAALHPAPRARAKAALLNLGRPATSAEIAMLANLPTRSVTRALSALPTVIRATGRRWMVSSSGSEGAQARTAEADLKRLRRARA